MLDIYGIFIVKCMENDILQNNCSSEAMCSNGISQHSLFFIFQFHNIIISPDNKTIKMIENIPMPHTFHYYSK